ncbi:hypothetical protein FRC16_002791 [Serendipita sp. 398]|nr:hypothetical protein FRC16_002791 [Serendipita sp. 398]
MSHSATPPTASPVNIVRLHQPVPTRPTRPTEARQSDLNCVYSFEQGLELLLNSSTSSFFRGHRIIHGVTSLAKYRCNVLHVRFYGKHFKKEPVIKPKKEPTVDQQAIVEALKKHNVAVIARPGSGKTETARFASKANPSWNILFLTYSRALKERAQKDFRHLKHVNVQTIHGYVVFSTVQYFL